MSSIHLIAKTSNPLMMGKLVEKLKSYLASASKKQIEKDWEELEHFNSVGPDVSEYVSKVLQEKRIEESERVNNISGSAWSSLYRAALVQEPIVPLEELVKQIKEMG